MKAFSVAGTGQPKPLNHNDMPLVGANQKGSFYGVCHAPRLVDTDSGFVPAMVKRRHVCAIAYGT